MNSTKNLRRRAYKIMTDLISSHDLTTWMKQFRTRGIKMVNKHVETYG